MSNTAILVEAQHKLDEAVRKMNRLARATAGEVSNYMTKSASVICALNPNVAARLFTDFITAQGEVMQATIELNQVRNAN